MSFQSKSKSDYDDNEKSGQKWQNGLQVFLGCTALLGMYKLITSQDAQFWFFPSAKPLLESNKIEGRLGTTQYPSNNPIEDRYAYRTFEKIPGFTAIVFDGHGGWMVAEFASRVLPDYLEQELAKVPEKLNSETYVRQAIDSAFDRVEMEYRAMASDGCKLGFGKFASVGACCLCSVVLDNKLYVANAGDCRGMLLSPNNDQGSDPANVSWQKLNAKQNADSKKVQKELRAKYPNEKDIIYCKRPPNSGCYVKGRLQPSRSFGDLRLKTPEFNNPENFPVTEQSGWRRPIKNFSGGYIDHKPEIRVFDIQPSSLGFLLASDG
jgi:pyruvate dehydrogenase phosphatase